MAPQTDKDDGRGLSEPLLKDEVSTGAAGAATQPQKQNSIAANGNGAPHGDYILLPVDQEESKDEHGRKKSNEKEGDDDEEQGSSSPPPPPVPISRLFYFADGMDILLMSVGGLASIGVGVIMPLFALIFSDTINAINIGTDEERRHNAYKYSMYFVGLACISFVLNAIQSSCFGIAAERQVKKMREQFLAAVLRQDIAWFDANNTGELATRIKGDTLVVQQGIGEKMGLAVQFFSTFVCGFVIGFSKGWQLALVMLSIVPLLGLSAAMLFSSVGKLATLGQKLYAEAGSVAEQSISSIRTVAAFTGEEKEANRYAVKLQKAQEVGIQSGKAIAQGLATVLFIIFASYGLGMWYGASEIVADHEKNPDCVMKGTCHVNGGDVLVVFWSILFASMSIGQCGPNLSAVAEAKGAAAKLIEIVLRKPSIDSDAEGGLKLPEVKGRIEFKNVHFRYPSRPEAKIFEGLNLTIEAGQTVALVGSSGSGKSTVVSLLERFYDVEEGDILVDGTNIKSLNLKYLRSQLGLISQEPTLFATSIAQNIAYGGAVDDNSLSEEEEKRRKKKGSSITRRTKGKGGGGYYQALLPPSAEEVELPMDKIIAAAKAANIHDTIMTFPEGYNTQVGEFGVQLSGGQRQRIAIARAILKEVPILLCDEATSALDTESERIVQAAIDRLVAAKKRTTIIIAHRLSTIKNCDVICVVHKGKIVEQGTHAELMDIPDGHYQSLVRLQTMPPASGNMSRVTSTASLGGGGAVPLDVPLLPPKAGDKKTSHHVHIKSNLTDAGGAADDSPITTSNNKASQGEGEGKEEELKPVSNRRLWQLSRPELRWVILALIMAVVNGCTFPAYSFFLSNIVSYLYDPDPHVVKTKAYFWAGMFPILAAVVAIATFTQILAFTVMGERLTTRLRDLAFRNILRQDIAWFDREENSTGAVTARLATEVTLVKNITGQNLGRSLQNVVTVCAAFTIAFVFGSWKMSVVLLGILPLMVLGAFAQMKALRTNTDKAQSNIAQAGSVAVQAISGIRTVTAFGMNRKLMSLYSTALKKPLVLGIRNGILRGFTLGVSQWITLSAYGLLFWYGTNLTLDAPPEKRAHTFQRVLRSLMAITMSSQGIGQNTSFLGDQAAAQSAAARIFAIVDRRPEIDSSVEESGEKLEKLEGRIEFKNVSFSYPSRPQATVFQSFSLKIEPGQTVALVGASGSGKSTVVQLLERFYDPQKGSVLIDGKDLRELNVKWWRSQIGLVSQEPILFGGADIAENIAYGIEPASREQIVDVAKKANAHEFITSFPDGYETEVGERGVQLSGGQKQRME